MLIFVKIISLFLWTPRSCWYCGCIQPWFFLLVYIFEIKQVFLVILDECVFQSPVSCGFCFVRNVGFLRVSIKAGCVYLSRSTIRRTCRRGQHRFRQCSRQGFLFNLCSCGFSVLLLAIRHQ
uniref:Uncharacterized protein n=1 Tax=Anopheles darlingi TaxID=43151 RepID=A0A2M4DD40_ANODA